MPTPETFHPLWKRYRPLWVKVRDSIEGEDKVKAGGADYLPRLSGHNTPEGEQAYDSYKNRAVWFPAPSRTVEALTGAVTRKAPELNWPSSKEEMLGTITVDGDPFSDVIDEALSETVGISRIGLLVDLPQEAGGDPFVSVYTAENIIDWQERVIDGRKAPVEITLVEPPPQSIRDRMEKKGKGKVLKQIRKLHLSYAVGEVLSDDGQELAPDQLVYWQQTWTKEEAKGGPTQDENDGWRAAKPMPVTTKVGDSPLREIPFVVINATGLGLKPGKPVMLDLANLAFSYYRNSADLEHGRHWTAIPQSWIASEKKFSSGLTMGGGNAWLLGDNGKAGMLEFTGAGLGNIQKGMEDKIKAMAAIGARILEERATAGIEAAETIKLRHAGEQSALAKISKHVSAGLTRVLGFIMLIEGKEADRASVSIALNTDFNVTGITPEELLAMFQVLLSGGISYDTFFYNLQRGEIIPENVTQEEEMMRIKSGLPMPEPPAPEGGEPELDDDTPDEGEGDDR